jgi:hypothetical protein
MRPESCSFILRDVVEPNFISRELPILLDVDYVGSISLYMLLNVIHPCDIFIGSKHITIVLNTISSG